MRINIKKIDRYVFQEVMTSFLAGVFFFAFVFLMFQMLRLSEMLIVNGAPISLLLPLSYHLIISFLPLGLPVAFLVGVLASFSRLSGDSEIVAMKASGMSLRRISMPVFLLSFFVAMFSLLVNLTMAPNSEVMVRNILLKIGNSRFTSSIKEGTFSSGFFNLLVYTEKVNQEGGRMERVFLYDERDPKHPFTVVSKKGEMIRVQAAPDDLGGMVLQLQEGSIHQSELETDAYSKSIFETYQIFFDIPDKTGQFGFKPKMMSWQELLSRRATETNPILIREFTTDLWRRLATATIPFFFVLLGVGFGTVRTRGARYGVMVVAFVTMGVYWQTQVTSIWWAEAGKLPAELSLMLPNLLIGIVGLIRFRRASW